MHWILYRSIRFTRTVRSDSLELALDLRQRSSRTPLTVLCLRQLHHPTGSFSPPFQYFPARITRPVFRGFIPPSRPLELDRRSTAEIVDHFDIAGITQCHGTPKTTKNQGLVTILSQNGFDLLGTNARRLHSAKLFTKAARSYHKSSLSHQPDQVKTTCNQLSRSQVHTQNLDRLQLSHAVTRGTHMQIRANCSNDLSAFSLRGTST